MRQCLLSVCLALLACAATSVFAGDVATETNESLIDWTVPDCDRIKGTNAVSYTTDDFVTMAPSGNLQQPVWTYGLTALEEANTLVAAPWSDNVATLLISEDAGCKWRKLGEISGCEPLTFATGPEGTIYAWTRGRAVFYRIQGDVITALQAPDELYGITIDPKNPMHIRIGSNECQLYESHNGGANFSVVGVPVNIGISLTFTVDFDPQDWDCALCGTKGAYRTTDGGNNWAKIIPFDLEDEDFAYTFAFSPVDSRRVWARGRLEVMELGPNGIFVSDDRGASFSLALADGTTTVDQNGIERVLAIPNIPTWAVHPENKDVLYYGWGCPHPVWDPYGTDFIRFDLSTGDIGLAHNDVLHDINAIEFNPADPTVIYLGLECKFITTGPTKTSGDQLRESMKMAVSPNPFNPSANISFSLPEAAQVKLDIYNLLGRKVATVVDKYFGAGEHTVSWHAGRFASGIYLVRLEAGSFAETKKIVLLK
ncbi:MAG: T9SS type A sorting domain-containing protein [Candidatus Zixiibacteriota bacterium]|nr:MAG: T9SS type A sorting domain-containing protein [candidate division Zixibacteria bacterium]